MMARQRYAPLQSDKHEQTWSNLVQDASSKININLVTPVQPASKNTNVEVGIGSKITWIYFEMHFAAEDITSPKVIHWTVSAARSGQTQAAPNLYYQLDRSSIFKRGMEMLPKNVATVYKRVFAVKIPKAYQRMRENQTIQLQYICSSAETINACGIAIYKEIY